MCWLLSLSDILLFMEFGKKIKPKASSTRCSSIAPNTNKLPSIQFNHNIENHHKQTAEHVNSVAWYFFSKNYGPAPFHSPSALVCKCSEPFVMMACLQCHSVMNNKSIEIGKANDNNSIGRTMRGHMWFDFIGMDCFQKTYRYSEGWFFSSSSCLLSITTTKIT